jgi:acetyl esterase/lipase
MTEGDHHTTAAMTKTITVTRRVDKTLKMRLLQLLIKPFRPRLATARKKSYPDSPQLTAPRAVQKRCNITERRVNDIWIYDLTPRSAKSDDGSPSHSKRRIYYFSGGGWQQSPSGGHWKVLAELTNRLSDTTISIVSYPLAPTCPASVTMPLLRTLYDSLMKESEGQGEHVVFMGDSSGGNIILCLVAWALQSPEARAPSALMCICPTTDLRHLDERIVDVVKKDPIFTAQSIEGTANAWAGDDKDEKEWGLSDARVSPALANFEPLKRRDVKIHGVIGTWDVLSVEAIAFRDRCSEQGIEGEWLEWEGQMHCFPLVFPYGFKESTESVDWIVRTLSQ